MRRAVATASFLALATLPLAGCEKDEPSTSSTVEIPGGGGGGGKAKECDPVPAAKPTRLNLKPPSEKVSPGERITATVKTNCGDFDIDLDKKRSPKTVASFVHLVKEGAYDGVPVQRVVPGYVIQAGDATGDDRNDPGYSVIEPPPPNTEYTEGTVAMAKMSVQPKGYSGMQFFVVTAADAGLQPDYAVLGRVAKGEEAVDRIDAQADPDLGKEGGAPANPVVIDRITLTR